MAEEQQQQEGQKTLVAFIVGLLIGGMLVWAFSGPETTAPVAEDDNASEESSDKENGSADTTDNGSEEGASSNETASTPTLPVGNGAVSVLDQTASDSVALDSATYPVSEGWIGVREYNNDKLGYILGAARFSESQGLVPTEIPLLRSTTAGNRYAIVVFTEDGVRNAAGNLEFNPAGDVQIAEIFDTFVAQ